MSMYTPWGKVQHTDKHFIGCITYSTASHGGMRIAPSLYKYLSEYTLKRGDKYSNAKGLWYEEDCAVLLPLYELSRVPEFYRQLSERYTAPTLEQVRQWFPDYSYTHVVRIEHMDGLWRMAHGKEYNLCDGDIVEVHNLDKTVERYIAHKNRRGLACQDCCMFEDNKCVRYCNGSKKSCILEGYILESLDTAMEGI